MVLVSVVRFSSAARVPTAHTPEDVKLAQTRCLSVALPVHAPGKLEPADQFLTDGISSPYRLYENAQWYQNPPKSPETPMLEK